ncbi:MAG: DEAD/DEAH box helicase [Thermoplasmatales archaeon]|nr:DEAD/DEAH box helicase [Thermoplasmatales archaeon]
MSVFRLLNEKIQKALEENNIIQPTEIQKLAIPKIIEGGNVLLIAPTGIGKTEAALLPVFDYFLRRELNSATLDFNVKSPLKDFRLRSLQKPVSILYITPLRSLNRDMLKRTTDFGKKLGINVMVRHGDTPMKERVYQSKNPPDMLITTPETLQILLLGEKLRQHLKNVRWVIVDEIHELAVSERGAQLSVALERLTELAGDFQRIGLSATIGSPDKVGKFLAGVGRDAEILKVSTTKNIEIDVESPATKKMDKEIADKTSSTLPTASCIRRCREVIEKHSSTLFFVNTRDTAESLAARFRLWDEKFSVGIHHGSLSKNVRIKMEDDFKNEKIKSLICTSSLELGIDIGSADFTLQYNSPRQVTRLVQRVGRSGHRIGETSKGKIIATDPDDIAESAVIAKKALSNELEEIKLRESPLCVLANQIVGFAMKEKRSIDDTIKTIKRAYPFRNLDKKTFISVLNQLKEERIIWFDNNFFGKRKNAIDYFYENISMIPDEKNYRVMDISSRNFVGILDERFVANYINEDATFIMKGVSWKVVEIKDDVINVEQISEIGEIPSWIGEELPVPFEVAVEVGKLRRQFGKIEKDYPASQETMKIFSDYIKKQTPVPNDRLITIENGKNIIIINACFGSKVNETIARILSSLITAKTGSSISIQTGPYRIILETSTRIKPEIVKKYLLETKLETVEEILRIVLKNSSYLKYQMLYVAKKFGMVRKDADYSIFGMHKLIELLRDTVIYDEAINRIIHEKMDVEKTKKILELIQNKKIDVQLTEITPIGLAGIEKRKELIGPELADREVLLALKKRLENEYTVLLCLSCRHHRKTGIKNVEDFRCPICNSVLVASINEKTVRNFGKFSEKEIKKIRKNANLILSHGKKALLCLAGRGIGVDTASRILRKRYETEEEFLRDILSAEINYARTKRFW